MAKRKSWIRVVGSRFVAGLSVFGLKFLPVFLKYLPLTVTYGLGRVLSAVYYLSARHNRRLALVNLRMALGDRYSEKELKRIARGSFRTMGHIVLDTLLYTNMPAEKVKRLIRIQGMEHLQTALARGRGVIAISAHLGSFTILAKRLTTEGIKTHFIARHARNKDVEKIIMKFCREAGQKIIFSQPVLSCMKTCRKVLARNEVVVIELDQNFGSEGQEIRFFNRPAVVAPGPVRISQSTQAAIVPMFIIRNPDNTHTLAIEPEAVLRGEEDEGEFIKENSQYLARIIEKAILRYPEQWANWIHKDWEKKKD